MTILTIILATGGVILLSVLLVFVVVRHRYRRKFRQEPVVNFQNRTYSSHAHDREPLPPPPAPHHVAHPRPSSSLYLTPLEDAPLYEEVQKPNGFVTQGKTTNNFQGTPSLPPACSDSHLGACGDAMLDELDDSEAPLMWNKAGSQDDLMKGPMVASVHNDYVDMNGSPVPSRTSQNAEEDGAQGITKPSEEGTQEAKQPLVNHYSNLSSPHDKSENVYERLP